jgi:hypothetical protein
MPVLANSILNALLGEYAGSANSAVVCEIRLKVAPYFAQ